MTLDDFRKLKTGDYVKFVGEVYRLTLSGYMKFEFDNCDKQSLFQKLKIQYYNPYMSTDIFINGLPTSYIEELIVQISEKEVLEIQLKDAEEQVQKDTARVDSIKAKLEELSKPKLKIGGLYRYRKHGENDCDFTGVLFSQDDYCYIFITTQFEIHNVYKTVSVNYYKEITNPKYSHIGKTIMEFIKLGERV